MMKRFLAIALACALPFSTTAQDVDPQLSTFADSLPTKLKQRVVRQDGRYLQQAAQQVFQISPDGVVTVDALRTFKLRNIAKQRSQQLMRFQQYDLDGDGIISAAEVAAQAKYLYANQRAELELATIEHDSNRDGALSAAEIAKAAEAGIRQHGSLKSQPADHELLQFDYDKNGRVTLSEIAQVIGAIDRTQVKTSRLPNPRTPKTAISCTAPKPMAGVETVFLSGRESRALSTVSLGGQDRITTVASVQIAKGNKPLYIYATTFDSVIWKFEGAVERIHQVVLQGRRSVAQSATGVIGVHPDKVAFVPYNTCIIGAPTKHNTEEDAKITTLSKLLGVSFDHVLVDYYITGYQIPMGIEAGLDAQLGNPYAEVTAFSLGETAFELSLKGLSLKGEDAPVLPRGNRSLREIMRSYPEGVIPLDPTQIVTRSKAAHYEVLPKTLGVLQLLAEDRIVRKSGVEYLVTEPIPRFPPELKTGRFFLAPDIPMPETPRGSYFVYSEETGKCLHGYKC